MARPSRLGIIASTPTGIEKKEIVIGDAPPGPGPGPNPGPNPTPVSDKFGYKKIALTLADKFPADKRVVFARLLGNTFKKVSKEFKPNPELSSDENIAELEKVTVNLNREAIQNPKEREAVSPALNALLAAINADAKVVTIDDMIQVWAEVGESWSSLTLGAKQ